MPIKYGDKKIKIAVFGTGWWSQFQIPAWLETGNIEIIALYNRTRSKAEALKKEFGLECRIYNDPEELFKNEEPDVADIITEAPFHAPLVRMAAGYRVPVVCQKPMAYDCETCVEMLEVCKNAGIPFIINENYRWQKPVRIVRKLIEEGRIGNPFRALIQLSTGGPEQLANQPFLKTLRHYVLFDLGVHAFDVARYLFGEPDRVYCQSLRTVDYIKGDDMASAMLTYKDMLCNILLTDMLDSKIVVEGLGGIIELTPDYSLKVIKKTGVEEIDCKTWNEYGWAQLGDVKILGGDVIDSIVQAQRNIMEELRYGKPAETTGAEYLKTMEITFAAIKSALTGESIPLFRY